MSDDVLPVTVQLEAMVDDWETFVDAVLVQAELAIERQEAEWLRRQQQEPVPSR